MKTLMTRRELLKLGVTVAAGSVLAACQPAKPPAEEVGRGTPVPVEAPPTHTPAPEKPAAKEPAKAEEKVELTYTTWGEGVVPGSEPPSFEKFFDDHPNIIVKHYSYPNYDQKLYLLLASGNMPEVFRTQDEPFVMNVKRGIYKNLDPLVERDSEAFQYDDFFPGAWASFMWEPDDEIYGEGSHFAVPNTGGCILWLVNLEVFEQAGVDLPEENGKNWTLDDFVEKGKGIRELDSQGRMTRGFYPWPWVVYNMPFVWTWGANYFNKEKTKCLLDSEESLKAHKWLWNVVHEWRLTPLAGAEMTGMSASELLISGKVAMQITGPWGRKPYTQAGPDFQDKWDIYHVPKNPETGYRATRTSWDATAISPQTEYVEEAWLVCKYMADQWFLEATLKRGEHGSSRISTAKGKYFGSNDETPQKEWVFNDALMEYSHLQPITEYWSQQWDIMGHYYDLMFNPETKMDPEEAVPKMTEDVQYLLDHGELPPGIG